MLAATAQRENANVMLHVAAMEPIDIDRIVNLSTANSSNRGPFVFGVLVSRVCGDCRHLRRRGIFESAIRSDILMRRRSIHGPSDEAPTRRQENLHRRE